MNEKRVHETSSVMSQEIGHNTRVWQFAVILEHAKIGANCNICAHTFIEGDVIIGDNVTVKSGVYIWNGVRIEDNVFVGPNATFTNDLNPRSNDHKESIETVIRANASIGANSTILAGVTMGKWAMSGIGSVITKDVPDHALVYGNPASIRGWVDREGSRLKRISSNRYVANTGKIFVYDGEKLLIGE